jgi:hypothetical protein
MENPAYRDRLASVLGAEELEPTSVVLPSSGRRVEILTLLRRERLWAGPVPTSFSAVPNKPALQYGDTPIWSEFALLRLLERDGWQGVWVKNWGGRAFWRDVLKPIELPPPAASLFSRIATHAARGGGCWDVFAWRDDDMLFIEAKRSGRDRLRLTQRTWLEGALAEGVPLSSFIIVEWVAT